MQSLLDVAVEAEDSPAPPFRRSDRELNDADGGSVADVERSWIGPPGWTAIGVGPSRKYFHSATGKTALVPPPLEPWQRRLQELM